MDRHIRKIIHIDMDAFYASIEQRDFPEYKNKPVIVGGDPHSRGVVSTCSYEARAYGVHSAMSSARAYQLCPQAIFVRPRFDAYQEVSHQIRKILLEYTDLVEPVSLDEAYLDVTENKKNCSSATWLAQEIKQKILFQTDLVASAGVSFNKFLAKIASDYQKPNGLTVITPLEAPSFLEKLTIGKFHGIGKVTEKKMIKLGIRNGQDLRKRSQEELIRYFGKAGVSYYECAHGLDSRPVIPSQERKSIGCEITLLHDIDDEEKMIEVLRDLADQLGKDMMKYGKKGKTLTLKIKFFNFMQITRSLTVDYLITSTQEIFSLAVQLLSRVDRENRAVRLLGISLSHFSSGLSENHCTKTEQLYFPFWIHN